MVTYYEDLAVGESISGGSHDVTEAEILDFATRFDPQWFHTDTERAASDSIFGNIIASGWHTAALTMRMAVDIHLEDAKALGGIGVDDLRWPNPVFPGETLSVVIEVTEKRPSETYSDRGIVKSEWTTANAAGETKLTMKPIVLYARSET